MDILTLFCCSVGPGGWYACYKANAKSRTQNADTDTQASLRGLLAKWNKGKAGAEGGCSTGQARLDRVQQGRQAETGNDGEADTSRNNQRAKSPMRTNQEEPRLSTVWSTKTLWWRGEKLSTGWLNWLEWAEECEKTSVCPSGCTTVCLSADPSTAEESWL